LAVCLLSFPRVFGLSGVGVVSCGKGMTIIVFPAPSHLL
jgi:hypothetical protein